MGTVSARTASLSEPMSYSRERATGHRACANQGLAAIINTTVNSIVGKERQPRTVRWKASTRAAERLFGYSEAEVAGATSAC